MRHDRVSRLPWAILGPRPVLILVIDDGFVAEIWVDGRTPHIVLCDHDGAGDGEMRSSTHEGFAFVETVWPGRPGSSASHLFRFSEPVF